MSSKKTKLVSSLRFSIKDFTILDLEKMLRRYYKEQGIKGPYNLNWPTPSFKKEQDRKNLLWQWCLKENLIK